MNSLYFIVLFDHAMHAQLSHLSEVPSPRAQLVQRPSWHEQDGGEGQHPAQHVGPDWVCVPAVKG